MSEMATRRAPYRFQSQARRRKTLELLTGNEAAAWGVRLSRPQIIPTYPITPQTPLLHQIATGIKSGVLKADFINMESDYSAMAAAIGASLGGAQVFTATNSQGLALMSEHLFYASGMRLPIVMAVVNRALSAPHSRFPDHNDALSVNRSGWIQLFCEDPQEVLDKNTAVAIPASCLATFSLSYSHSAWKVPFVHSLFESGPALATGLKRAYEFLGKKVHVVCFAGDAGTMDIGFQALSGAAARNEDLIHICYDNEVAMNTGGQATSSSPHRTFTPTTPGGMPFFKKDGPKIMAAHNIPYVATASVSHIEDYKSKLRKAAEIKGLRYIHVLSPCPISWGYPYEQTREVARNAVETGIWMLYEVEEGRFRLTFRPARRRPVKDYFSAQERYRLLKPKEVASIQRQVDKAWRALS